MPDQPRSSSWLHTFRRTLAFLRPQRGRLTIGLLAAVGVSIFYTFSISSVVPMLKIVFAEHETLVDWLNRVEVEKRLRVEIGDNLPDDPDGLLIRVVLDDSRSTDMLYNGDRIVSIGGKRLRSHEVLRTIANHDALTLDSVGIESVEGLSHNVRLQLGPMKHWSHLVRRAAGILPQGKDPTSRMRTLVLVMGALVIVSLLGGLCRLINEGMIATAVQHGMHDLRSTMAEHVLRLPLAWHSAQPPGDTLGRFTTDLSKIEVAQVTLLGKVIREPLKAVGVLALTLAIDWRLLVVALIGMPIGAWVMRRLGRVVKRSQKRASSSWGRLLDLLGEKLAGIRVVKAYGAQDEESRRFRAEAARLRRAQTHIEVVDAATKPLLETLSVAAVAAFILYGGSRVFNQQLEPHLFFASIVCMGGIFDPIRKLGNVNNRLEAGDASAERIYALLDTPAEEPRGSLENGVALARFSERIEFEDVRFAYASNAAKSVLNGISLTVRSGEVIALVGPNGSGKTTLLSLLLRFYTPLRGRILIDGTDIAGVALHTLRSQIGLVTQEAVVFSGTVRGNIAYGAGAVADDDVRRAARLAHVDDFIEQLRLTHNGVVASGYDAHITSRSLSGGQRQRIALARAILRDPPILILDEATSQIDSESERRIQEALEDVTRGRTTFVIAHRYSTISRADRIVVLDQGCIVADGNHEALLKSCPFYVSLFETQLVAGA